MAREEGVPFLAKIAMSQMVSITLDDGEPFVIKYPDSDESKGIVHVVDALIRQCEGD